MARINAGDDAREGYYPIQALFLSGENCDEIIDG
jgi:hypothetical protein